MNYFEEHDAIVVNNEDPDKLGKIKVKCASLLDEEQELPFWIPPRFHYVGIGGGWFGIPAKDSWVKIDVPVESQWDEVPFEQSLSSDAGIRWQCTAYNDIQTLPKIFKTNYPQRVGYAWPSGFALFVDEKDSEMNVGYFDGATPTTWIKITKTKIDIMAENVRIGGDSATEHFVFGDVLETYLSHAVTGLKFWLDNHVHTHPQGPTTGLVTSSPAIPSPLLSTKHTVE